MDHSKSRVVDDAATSVAAVIELARCLLNASDERDIFACAVDQLRQPLNADCVTALGISDDGRGLELVAGSGAAAAGVGRQVVEFGSDTVTEYALGHDRPLVVADVDHDRRFAPSPIATEYQFRSSISAGLLAGGRPRGVLEWHWRQPRAVPAELVELTASVVGLLSDALDRLQRERHSAWIADSVGEAVVLADADHTIVQVNQALCDLTGRGRQDLIGCAYEDIASEDLSELNHRLATQDRARQQVSLVSDERGGVVTEVYASRIDHHILLVVNDITDMARTEREYRKFFLLVENARELIGLADLDGTVTYLNPAGADMLGLDHGEAVGRSVEEFVSPDQRRRFFGEIIPEVIDVGRWSGELDVCQFDDNTFRQTDAILALLREPSSGRPAGFATVLHDVSERKRLRNELRQSQKLEALGLLATGIAHDFNNHLTVIKGYSELLLETLPRDEAGRDQLDKVLQVSLKAQHLADQLMTFSRRKVRQPQVLDLNEVVQNLYDMLRSLIGEHIDLGVETSDQPAYVEVDASDIEQVVLNLAVNANDAIDGTGQIHVRLRSHRGRDFQDLPVDDGKLVDPVVMEVRDSGPGIAPDAIDHIFDPFYTTKAPDQGTGLGLATVKRIVADAGGQVRVESTRDIGTCFLLYFPRANAPEGADSADDDTADESLTGDELVLVIEDCAEVRDYLVELLQGYGYRTIAAEDGARAEELLADEATKIDAVICDLVVPKLGISEIRTRIVEPYPDTAVILTSGYADYPSIEHEHELVDIPFIPKPMAPTELLGQLRNVLR